MRDPELDQFGPWVLTVRTPEEVPPLYRDAGVDLAHALTVLKFPRPIARRDVTPGMDLYDHLLVLDADRLRLLSRVGTTYQDVDVPVADILAIENSVDLLDGRLVLHGVGSAPPPPPSGRYAPPAHHGPAVTLRYNGSQLDVVQDLVGLLRREAFSAGHGAPTTTSQEPPLDLDALGPDDVALVTSQRELVRAHPGLGAPALQQRRIVRRRASRLSGLMDLLRPVTVQAAVVSADERELHVLDRRARATTGAGPVTSVAHTVVPLRSGTALSVRDHPGLQDAVIASIVSGQVAISLLCLPDGPVLESLASLLPSTSGAVPGPA